MSTQVTVRALFFRPMIIEISQDGSIGLSVALQYAAGVQVEMGAYNICVNICVPTVWKQNHSDEAHFPVLTGTCVQTITLRASHLWEEEMQFLLLTGNCRLTTRCVVAINGN